MAKTAALSIGLVSFVLLLRVLVGFQPHSGQDNFHGAKRAYGGDFEAQRHWLELTLHLPIGDWYWHDLEYWGLDYPPLTAYASWICGFLSHRIVGPESVMLFDSRGIEDPIVKSYMRATVLVLDLLIFFPIIWVTTKKSNWMRLMALSQPAIILIDHGHFQYNSVSLGFALWGFWFVTKKDFSNCILGSIFFCLALNFKQMTLYYAPAIFAYLLGRCFQDSKQLIPRFCLLGATVILTFALLWWPFIYYPPSDDHSITPLQRFVHVLHRLFPFQRGLFEGKVSNLWCTLSTKPISIRNRIPEDLQPFLALGLTLILTLPACYKLFIVGQSGRQDSWNMLLWGGTSTALAFFLASFQVHEKSILLAVAPLSMLWLEDSTFVNWFSVVAVWTLWPLIQVDRLEIAYLCITSVYLGLVWIWSENAKATPSFFHQNALVQVLVPVSALGIIGLHLLEMVIPVPKNLPDLFPVLWSITGCGMFCVSWIATCWHMFRKEKAS
jgi:alpha-1,3-glucosyltransferase